MEHDEKRCKQGVKLRDRCVRSLIVDMNNISMRGYETDSSSRSFVKRDLNSSQEELHNKQVLILDLNPVTFISYKSFKEDLKKARCCESNRLGSNFIVLWRAGLRGAICVPLCVVL